MLRRTHAFKEIILSGSVLPGHVDYSVSTGSVSNFTRHAVRVKVVPYPEQICAVWVIIAVCYMKE